MKRSLILWIVLASALPLCAETLASPSDVTKLTDNVMKDLVSANYTSAISKMKAVSILGDQNFEKIQSSLESQIPKMEAVYGKTLSFQTLGQDKINNAIFRVRYLDLREKFALRWTFIFYNNGTGWTLISFSFDDEILKLFPDEYPSNH
jgi:hypothetical protein